MKVVALISGGKDSCYNMIQCVNNNHEIVALANLYPLPNNNNQDEIDSYMYQTVGWNMIEAYVECMSLPLFRAPITGKPQLSTLDYQPTKDDEVEDLYLLLKRVKEHIPDVEGVSSGAILSTYQKLRVENVCSRLGLVSLAYLWQREQKALLQDMIASNIKAILIKVAVIGLDASHLGKTLEEIYPHLIHLEQKYGINVCGEGGEYETLTLDCPLFKKSIIIDSTKAIEHSADAFAPVFYLRLLTYHLETKT